jgi:Flp pilus assembly pilin Flp
MAANPRSIALLKYLATWTQLRRDRRGVTSLEYGLIAGLLVAVIFVLLGLWFR